MRECEWFEPANKGARGTRRAWVDDFPPPGISGVYAIANLQGVVLYVGESHTDRLRKTLARHFQQWDDPDQARWTYDRFRVQVCWMQTSPSEAEEAERDWTEKLDPRDSEALGEYADVADDLGDNVDFSEVPF